MRNVFSIYMICIKNLIIMRGIEQLIYVCDVTFSFFWNSHQERVLCGLKQTFKVSFWSSGTCEIREEIAKALSCRCPIGNYYSFCCWAKATRLHPYFCLWKIEMSNIVLIFFRMSMLQAPHILCIGKALRSIQWPLKVLSYNEIGRGCCISHLFALLFGRNGS